MSELMTVKEVAKYLRVTKRTMYRLLREDAFPATKVRHQWRFDKESVDEWLRRKSIGRPAAVLVIDDENSVQLLIKKTLEELGHKVTAVGNAEEGLELVKQADFDLIFLDLKMPGMDGAELFRQIKKIKPKVSVAIITGYPDSEILSRALAQGPLGVMKKPFGESDIIAAVRNFLRISS